MSKYKLIIEYYVLYESKSFANAKTFAKLPFCHKNYCFILRVWNTAKLSLLASKVLTSRIHLLLSILPKMSAGVSGNIKGKSSLIIYQNFGTVKFQYRLEDFDALDTI